MNGRYMDNSKVKCEKCGKMVDTILEKDDSCFDEIIYIRRCVNCGHMIDSFSVEK